MPVSSLPIRGWRLFCARNKEGEPLRMRLEENENIPRLFSMFLNQALRAGRIATDDEKKIKKSLDEVEQR
jgi:hypothetical protein